MSYSTAPERAKDHVREKDVDLRTRTGIPEVFGGAALG